jgi:5-formyltetrahydrofolate cyclo-ligase
MRSQATKSELRRDILTVRAALTADDVSATGVTLGRRALELPELATARTIGAYVSVGREPGTRPLLDALRTRGIRVLLPVLLEDNDLDWGAYEGAGRLVAAGRGLLEPDGPRLGPNAITEADAVLLPGLAVDERGMRLGRGGGSYDRVLARLEKTGANPALIVLLYDGELLGMVPVEEHDKPVHAAVTPSAVRRFGRPPGSR